MSAAAVRGAYGLALPDLPGQKWLMPAPPQWKAWRVVQELRSEPLPVQELSAQRAVLHASPGHIVVDRPTATTRIVADRAHPDAAFVHPLLAFTALPYAEWTGRLALHAGAFIAGRGTWGVLGDRRLGKSTMLAWLAAHGREVVCDDTLLTDGDIVLAGPRCIDLRADASERLGLGTAIGAVGARRRWRETLPDLAGETPLAGWISLEWGAALALRPVPADQRFARIAAQRALRVAQQHPLAWLGVVQKPMYVFTRPRAWTAIDDAMTFLIERLIASDWT